MSDKKQEKDERSRGRSNRRERIPFGGMKLKLSLDDNTKKRLKSQGLIPRWFNDEAHGERLRLAQQAGYDFVTAEGTEQVGDSKNPQERDRRIKRIVGSNQDGSPKYAYLMAIPIEYYEEDKKAKEEVNKQVDDAIRGGEPQGVQHHGVDPSKGGTTVKNINYNP